MKKLAQSFVAIMFSLFLLVSSVSVASAANNMANVSPKATVGYNAVKLSWSAVSKATGYQVQQYKNKQWVALTSELKATSYTVSGLTTGTTYKFRVRAYRKKLVGTDYSKAWTEISAKPMPAKVSGLKATNYSGTVVKLSWSKVSGATGYEVYRSTDGKKWTKVGSTAKTSCNITKLSINKTYQFKVRAYRKASGKTYNGAASSAVKIKVVVPKVATLKGTSSTYNTLTLSWSSVPSASKYQLDVYDYSTKKWKKLKEVKGTSYKVSGLVTGKKYGFRVRAIQTISGKNYAGAYSPSYSYTTKLSNASSFKVTGLTATSVGVSWAKVAGATGYQVYVSYDSGKTWSKALDKYTSTTKTFKLKADTAYQLKVRAYRTAGGITSYGGYSDVLKVVTPVSKIAGFKLSESKGDVIATWTKAKNASGYALYMREKLTDENGTQSWSAWTTVNSSISKSASGSVVDFFKNDTDYQIRMREYVTVEGKTYYSAYSSTLDYFREGIKQIGSYSVGDSQYVATIGWTPVEGAASYRVEKYYQISDMWLSQTVEDTEITDNLIETGTTFRVAALDAEGGTIKTYPDFTATAPGFAVNTSDYSVDLSWPAVKGAKYYAVCVTYKNPITNVLQKLTTATTLKNLYIEPGTSRIAIIALAEKPTSNIITLSTAVEDTEGGRCYYFMDVSLPELNVVTDTSSSIYNESVNSQLLYFVGAVNRTKHSNRKVTITSNSEVSYKLAKIIVGDEEYEGEGIETFLNLVQAGKDDDEKLKLSDTAITNDSKTFVNSGYKYTYKDADGVTRQATLKLSDYVEPSDSDIAYLYNSNDPAAWKKGISNVTTTKLGDGSTKISFKVKQEVFGAKLSQTKAYYHPGLITTIADMDDFTGGMANERTSVGTTTITAVIGTNGMLESYSSISPYDMKLFADLGEDDKGNSISIGMQLSGNSKLNYTFVR